MNPHKYHCFGLNIVSAIPLSDLAPAEFENADLTILQESIKAPDRNLIPDGEGCWQASEEVADYYWAEVGSVRVRGGQVIEIDPVPGASQTALRLTLQGPALATALHQRGYLVLHASAFLTDTGVVGFVGPSGSGKSTSLAALLENGNVQFTDDLLVIDLNQESVPTVLPGPSLVKLWPGVVSAQGRDPNNLPVLGEGYLKRVDRRERSSIPAQAVLRRIYLVLPDDELEIESIPATDALMELMTHSYCSEILRFSGESQNFAQCSTLLQNVTVKRIRRGNSLHRLSELASMVEKDLAQDYSPDS